MKQIIINCAEIASMAELHALLARELNFPSWYGANYDALHDQLTALTEETRLILKGEFPFPARILMRVLKDCQEENPLFTVIF